MEPMTNTVQPIGLKNVCLIALRMRMINYLSRDGVNANPEGSYAGTKN